MEKIAQPGEARYNLSPPKQLANAAQQLHIQLIYSVATKTIKDIAAINKEYLFVTFRVGITQPREKRMNREKSNPLSFAFSGIVARLPFKKSLFGNNVFII